MPLTMKASTIVIAALALANIATAAALSYRHVDPQIHVDHLEDMRLAMPEGNLQARLGDSKSRTSVTLVFTPHGALQLHHELGRMFGLIEKKAEEERARGQPAVAESPHRSL